MVSDEEFQRLVSTINQQKGELLYLHALHTALMRSLPENLKIATLNHFANTVESMRRSLLFSDAPDEVMSSFDHYVKTLLSPKPKDSGDKI